MTSSGVESAVVARFDSVEVAFRRPFKGPVRALTGLSLEVKKGAVLGLLGPNGAGKTTALGCLLGLLRPGRGEVHRFGRRVTTIGRQPAAEQVGVLLEETRLPPFLSVHRALETVCAVRGLSGAKSKAELDRIVQTCRVEPLLDRRAGSLSKGQARKVGLAAALIADPPLLVLDEPSAGLDVEVRLQFEDMLRRLNDGRRTVIIASHLLGEVETACTQIAVMVDGRTAVTGATAELLEQARAGGGNEIHVPGASAALLDRLGLSYQPSRYPGLLLVVEAMDDRELMNRLVQAGVVPERVEPRATIAAFYLDAVRGEK